MVDRQTLIDAMNQIEQELCNMEKHRGTVCAEERWWENNNPKHMKAMYRCMWIVLEYLIRRDKK